MVCLSMMRGYYHSKCAEVCEKEEDMNSQHIMPKQYALGMNPSRHFSECTPELNLLSFFVGFCGVISLG